MKKRLKPVLYVFLIFALVGAVRSETSGSLPLLKMAPDARSVALGETGVTGSVGAFAVFHNPALLAFADHSQAAFAYSDWLLDLSLQSGAVHFNYQKVDVGLSFNVFNTPGLERRVLPADEPLGTFSAHDLATGLSLAYTFGDHLALGVTGRYLYQQIDVNEASGLAGDFGLAYRLKFRHLSAAIAARNLGKMQALLQEETPLPADVALGISGDIVTGKNIAIRGQVDEQYLLDDDLRLHTGLECGWKEQLFLRAGYQTGSELRTFSGGVGLAWQRFKFDYAYQPLLEDFEASHRFALSIDF